MFNPETFFDAQMCESSRYSIVCSSVEFLTTQYLELPPITMNLTTYSQVDFYMDGAITPEEQFMWMSQQFIEVIAENKRILFKMDQIQRKILGLQKEQHKILCDHRKIIDATNQLEIICKAIQAENQMMKDGAVAQIKDAWEKACAQPESFPGPYSPVTLLIERIRKINVGIEEEGNELAQYIATAPHSEEFKKRDMIAAEIEFRLRFPPAVSVLENELINNNKKLRLERCQLEEKLKKTYGNMTRLKMMINAYNDKHAYLEKVLIKGNGSTWVPFKVEMDKMYFNLSQFERKISIVCDNWNASNSQLCEFLDDVKKFNGEAVEANEKILQLCRMCNILQAERNDLLCQILCKNPPGSSM